MSISLLPASFRDGGNTMTRRNKEEKAASTRSFSGRQKEVSPAAVPILEFDGNGWCEELQRSYYTGKMRPKSMEEYEVLKKYARQD